MVLQLVYGINGLSCICKAQFCYVCSKKWKNCECPLFSFEELDDDVGVVADWVQNDADVVADWAHDESGGVAGWAHEYAGVFSDGAAAGNVRVPRYRRRTIFRAERAVERYNKFLWQTWGRRDPRSREEQIREVRHEVENGCDHGYWRRDEMTIQRPGHCKLCKYVGHKYILQCLFCPLTSCYNCHTDAPPAYRRVEEDE